MNRLIVASTNRKKASEIREVLGDLPGWSVELMPEGLPDFEETGETFLENAAGKAAFYSQHTDGMTVADDSGLEIDALGGRPGIRSARYAPTDPERIQRVLTELRDVPDEQRQAHFRCAVALARRGRVLWTGEGRVEGFVAREPRGTGGFGYDPVFFLPELGCTMAELAASKKNQISHRSRALALLREHLMSGFK